jgi:UDP-glucuronate decarboxylase
MAVGDYERVVVTGASGWVGRNAVDLLVDRLGDAFRDRVVLSATQARTIDTDAGTIEVIATPDLMGLAPGPRTLIIHCGFPTQEQVEVVGEDPYVKAVTRLRVLMWYLVQRLGAVDMVYISSGAATSVERGDDVAARTRVYGQAKIDDEVAYAETVTAAGGRLCIVRAFALSGPYMTKPETYALGSLILQAQRSGTIEVMANRPVRRSYMAIGDMLRVAIHGVGALEPGDDLRFETAGEVVEVGELARRTLALLGRDPRAISRPAMDPGALPNDYLGDPAAVGALASAAGVVPASLDDQIAVTAEWLVRNEAS